MLLNDPNMQCAEVIRSGDLISYTGEEGLRRLGEGKMLVSDSYPGQDRTKICLSQKVAVLQPEPEEQDNSLSCLRIFCRLLRKLDEILLPVSTLDRYFWQLHR